jgi:hypothetical protein
MSDGALSWYDDPIPSNNQQFRSLPFGVPVFQFPNLTLGGQQNFPNYSWMKQYPARVEVNWHPGKHDVKFGGEFLKDRHTKVWDLNRRGTFTFNGKPSTAIPGGRVPAELVGQPGGVGSEPAAAVPAAVLPSSSTKDYLVDVAPARRGGVGSATTGA